MDISLNGKTVNIKKSIDLNTIQSDLNTFISDTFTALGAKVTGDYSLEFTMDSDTYGELADSGIIKSGDTLVLNLHKIQDKSPISNTGGSSENIPVESITFDIKEKTPEAPGETFKITADVKPSDASDKTLKWSSSDETAATVNNKGEVTIKSNKDAVITAAASNGVKAELHIKPAEFKDFTLSDTNIKIILDVTGDVTLKYNINPVILQNSIQAQFQSSDSSVASVDSGGKITAKKAGTARITVTINGKQETCDVTVENKPVNYISVTGVTISKNEEEYDFAAVKNTNISSFVSVSPSNATDKSLTYSSGNSNVAAVDNSGNITFNSTGEAVITVASRDNPNAKATFKAIVSTYAAAIDFEAFEYGVALGKTVTINPILDGSPTNTAVTYSSADTRIASVNDKGVVTGNNLGDTVITAETKNGKKATYKIGVYTPVDMNNPSTLQGTYDIVDFNQSNGILNMGTNAYGGVERVIGEVTIKIDGSNATVISKIQMNSSTIYNYTGIGKDKAYEGLFSTVEFTKMTSTSSGLQSSDYKSSLGTFEQGKKQAGKISQETNGQLKIHQIFKESGIATVNVNTFIKKKTNEVKNIKNNERYFDYMDKQHSEDSHAKLKGFGTTASPEPYYTYGVVQ